MAWQSPKDWSSGEVVTAANVNQEVRDNIKWLSHDGTDGAPMARAYNTASQTLTTGTTTVITFDSERFDVGTLHSTSSNTSRMTIPTGGGGTYLLGATIVWENLDTGYRATFLRYEETTNIANEAARSISGRSMANCPSTLYKAAATDIFDVTCRHTQAADLEVSFIANSSPEFWALWVGE